MATVYLARDRKHDRPVAIKVLRPELSAAMGPDRFQREITLATRLQHPHILSIYDSGVIEATPATSPLYWFAMPYVEGESLRARLERERQLPIDDALRIAHEVARALDHAHRHGVILATSSRRTSCSPKTASLWLPTSAWAARWTIPMPAAA